MNYQRLKIFRPCISSRLTQHFGENRACVNLQTGKITGTSTKCPSGTTPYYPSVGLRGHNGNDLAGIKGEDIYHAATFDGWWRTEVDAAGGIGVDIVSNEPLFFPMPIPTELINTAVPHTQNGVQGFTHYVKMRYWHLSKAVGFNGKQVTCGTVIGLMGNTGASSGTHLHFAPKWCLKDGTSVASNNGYYGAFDPNPYYTHTTTAKNHAVYLKQDPLPLTPVEVKDITNQLTQLQTVLLALQKLIHLL